MKFLVTAALIGAAAAYADSARCCNELKSTALGGKVFFPSSAKYNASVQSYWSNIVQLGPTCVVLPTTAEDVSLAVKSLVKNNRVGPCRFAVRSGGHTPWFGAASIKDGVTIDLSPLNRTVYNKGNSTASIGPGARWKSVYETLDQIGVAVPGGRAGTVGVGGLILGGGNSFFAARFGLVCDNVVNFEIVLGDGRIVNANKDSNSDLFQALKGGGNNLGIVTRFDLYAFAQGNLWGGVAVYSANTTSQQISAFVDFGNNIVKDEYGSLISFWQYTSEDDQTIVLNAYEYTKPVVYPPPFAKHQRISGKIADTTRLSNLSDLTGELEQVYGFRDGFYTNTFVNDARVFQKAIDIYKDSIAYAKQNAVGTYRIVALFQPIPTVFAKHSRERGGNILGLDRAKENLILFLADLSWLDARDDALFARIGQSTIGQVNKYAASIDKANEYVYMNYADQTQNPLRSYGAANLRKLREVARKYDPEGVFQTLVPGGFKLVAPNSMPSGQHWGEEFRYAQSWLPS